MNRLLCLIALAACALAARAEDAKAADAPAPAPAAAAPAADTPLAKVGDSVITADEFSRFARYRLQRISMEQGKQAEADPKFRTQAMGELVMSHLLEQLAKDNKVTVTDEEVAKDFEESKKQFKTPEVYQQYLKDQNLTEDQLRQEIRRKLVVNKFVESQTKDIKVAPEDVQKQYDQLKSAGKMNRDTRTADLLQIVALYVEGDAESEKSAKERIEKVRERIVKGEKFEEVGQEVSKDEKAAMQMGAIDEAKPASLYKDIGKVVETLKPGDVSEVLKTPRGFGIVTVKAWYEPGVVPIDKVKEKLERALVMAKQREFISNLVKGAREKIPVEMYKAQPGEAGAAAPAPAAAPATPAAPDLSNTQ